MLDPDATNFGFRPRGNSRAGGNGDSVIEGDSFYPRGISLAGGETLLFWVDLTKAGLINESFTYVYYNSSHPTTVTGSRLNIFIPQAKIGNGNYVSVWSGGANAMYSGGWFNSDNINYFALSKITAINNGDGVPNASLGLTVKQAHAIDSKIDDSRPTIGRITINYADNGTANWRLTLPPSAVSDSSSTCYNTTTYNYSIGVNSGNGVNCNISIRFN